MKMTSKGFKPAQSEPQYHSDNLLQNFRKWQKTHSNVMTPTILRLKQSGNNIIELSEGTGFEHEPIYGVSVLRKTEKGFESDPTSNKSKMFMIKEDADDYFRKL